MSNKRDELLGIQHYKVEPMTNIPTTGKVILKFWAEWCGPCKAYKKDFDAATQGLDDVEVIEINVDKDSDLASKYGIRGIPSTLFILNDEVKGTLVGNHTPERILQQMKDSFETFVVEPRDVIPPTTLKHVREAMEEAPAYALAAIGMSIDTRVNLIRTKVDILKLKSDPGNLQYADRETMEQLDEALVQINKMLKE